MVLPAASKARRSTDFWKFRRLVGLDSLDMLEISSLLTVTAMPLLAKPELRAALLMPLTTCWPEAVAAGTMTPPGHMQKENTPC